MKILVTGGQGFLGLNLIKKLVGLGHEVVSIDNGSTSDPHALVLAGFVDADNPRFIRGDVGEWDGGFPLHVMRRHNFDLVFHLGCPASPKRYRAMPLATLGAAINGTYRLCSTFECPVIIMSSSEVYGEPLQSPQREDLRAHLNTTGPRASYDLGKAAGEAIAMEFPHAYLVRIFNTYGSYMHPDDGRVVPEFIKAAIRKEFMPIQGGWQTRSFCYVDDLVEGLVQVGMQAIYSPIPKVMNLGNPSEITIEHLAQTIWALVNPGETMLCADAVQLPQDDPTRRCPDISLARAHLGWEPQVPLVDGLDRTIAYFRRRLAIV